MSGPLTKHLWECHHPYYAQEGNFYENGQHQRFETIDELIDHITDADHDYDRIVRWDWKTNEDHPTMARLFVQIVGQRRAILRSVEAPVTHADEDKVIAALQPYAQLNLEVWEPFGHTLEVPSWGMTKGGSFSYGRVSVTSRIDGEDLWNVTCRGLPDVLRVKGLDAAKAIGERMWEDYYRPVPKVTDAELDVATRALVREYGQVMGDNQARNIAYTALVAVRFAHFNKEPKA